LQKSAEAIVGSGAEGPNNEAESRTDDLEARRCSRSTREGGHGAGCRPEAER
jgi:hypothetical protein